MNFKEALAILEVDESMSHEEVRKAYRDLVEVWHPDRYAHNPRLTDKANDKLKKINSAYDTVQGYLKKYHKKGAFSKSTEPTKQESFVFVKCVNCGITNRISKIRANDSSIKCGKCGGSPYKRTSTNTTERQHKDRVFCGLDSCTGSILTTGFCSECARTLAGGKQAQKDIKQAAQVR